MNAIVELSIIPLGAGLSLFKHIIECEKILNNRNLTIQLHAEGTNIEDGFNTVEALTKEEKNRCPATLGIR